VQIPLVSRAILAWEIFKMLLEVVDVRI
jgi:hypothetical protein